MDFSNLDNQNYSETTLKGFLLKNVDPKTSDPNVRELNNFLVKRVDRFWEEVIVPLRNNKHFDGNKINWYFQIYKEGHDARKLANHPFTFASIDRKTVEDLTNYLREKTVTEYLELGTSFLSNSFTLLSSWLRDQLVYKRLQTIYVSDDPCDWILRAEEEENGTMSDNTCDIDGLTNVIRNIGTLMSRRV